MTFWLVLTVNSVTFGGLLFLLSAGFSLIFGLMRIPNLTHGSLFMLGAYFGATFIIGVLGVQLNFWLAAILATLVVAALGALTERLLLRKLPGDQLAQVLVTLGLSFMAADFCLMVWGGDPLNVTTPDGLGGFTRLGTLVFPVEIELLSADGTTRRVSWDGQGSYVRIEHRGSSRLAAAVVDPDHRVLMDRDLTNNARRAGRAGPGRALASRVLDHVSYAVELLLAAIGP